VKFGTQTAVEKVSQPSQEKGTGDLFLSHLREGKNPGWNLLQPGRSIITVEGEGKRTTRKRVIHFYHQAGKSQTQNKKGKGK